MRDHIRAQRVLVFVGLLVVGCRSSQGSKPAPTVVCGAKVGLTAPVPVCSVSEPCDRALDRGAAISSPSAVPSCKTTRAGRPIYDDGPPRSSTDAAGTMRYACVFAPPGASAKEPRHRALGVPSTNPDVANLDAEIDRFVRDGKIDRTRLFITGWSNGARFAQLYAIARHETPTAGGNRIRAAAVYSGTDPFNGLGQQPGCALVPYPKSSVPILLVGRACDLLPCNAAQARQLSSARAPEPGDEMEQWASDLRVKVGDPNVERMIIAASGEIVRECSTDCGPLRALTNHVRWPDGVADESRADHEPAMLSFLRSAPNVVLHRAC